MEEGPPKRGVPVAVAEPKMLVAGAAAVPVASPPAAAAGGELPKARPVEAPVAAFAPKAVVRKDRR